MPLVADAKKIQAAHSASVLNSSFRFFAHNPAVHSQRLSVHYQRRQIYAGETQPAAAGSRPQRTCPGRTPCIA